MSKCKWIDCDNESRSKSDFCSDTCSKRDRRSRTTMYEQPGQIGAQPGQINPDNPDKPQPGHEPGQVTGTVNNDDHITCNLRDIPAAMVASDEVYLSCECTHRHCQAMRARGVNTPAHDHQDADQIQSHYGQTKEKLVNRVSLPGDVDYAGYALT